MLEIEWLGKTVFKVVLWGEFPAFCRADVKTGAWVWVFKLKWLFLPKQKTIKHEK